MSGVKRYDAHYLAEGAMGGKALASAEMVLASDYDRDMQALREDRDSQQRACIDVMAERDALRAQIEAMRALLTDARRYVDKAWPDGVHSYRTNSVSGDLLGRIDAALQAKP